MSRIKEEVQEPTSRTPCCARLFVLASGAALVIAGCGAQQTTASKSAAALDRQGGQVGKALGHGDHTAPAGSPASPTAGMPDSMAAPASDAHTAHGPSAPTVTGHEGHSMGGATPGTASDPHAGHLATSPSTGAAMSGTGTTDEHAHHAGMAMGPAAVEPSSASAAPGQAAATLRPDPLDAPASTAVEEAAKATHLADGMSSEGHHMSHGAYSHVDAGRVEASTPDAHRQHEHPVPTPSPRPSPSTEDNR
jgi:hypothetical protein